MKKIIAIVGLVILGTGAFAQQTKPAQSTSRTDTMNRNTDRVIGNKKDNPMVTDTASGGDATPPHPKTPDKVKEKAATENSMALPDPSTTYNRSSNGGLGTDHLPKTTAPKSSNSGKEKAAGNEKANKTTAPAAGESHTGGSAATNATGKTKMGTTGTGYSTGSHAGENSGNTQPKTSGQGKVKRDSIR